MNRWLVVAWYRTEVGLVDAHFDIEELDDLGDLIECGPSWQALEKIEIIYAVPLDKLTIEEAAKQ